MIPRRTASWYRCARSGSHRSSASWGNLGVIVADNIARLTLLLRPSQFLLEKRRDTPFQQRCVVVGENVRVTCEQTVHCPAGCSPRCPTERVLLIPTTMLFELKPNLPILFEFYLIAAAAAGGSRPPVPLLP